MAKAKGGFKPADLKKYYFWIVLPLILILSIVFTFVAKAKIKKDYVAKAEAIESAKKGADDVAANKKHPNDNTIKGIKAETDVLKENVYNSWELMYGDQKMRNRWPRQLSREFLDLVENKLKWRDPIGRGKPYLLEDYGFFIANHLPDLLVEMNRRRCQVKHYKLIKKNEMTLLGIQGLDERFWPVYVSHDADGNEITYVGVYSNPEDPKSPIKDVYLYDVKKDLISNIDDSQLRDELKAIAEPEPYWLDVDPWIQTPKEYMYSGGSDQDLQNIMQAVSGMGGSGGSGGMMGGGMMMGGSGGSGGGRGSMEGGMGGSGGESGMGGGLAGLGIGQVPGDGVDPALEQVSGTSLEELAGGGMAGMGGAGGRGAGGMGAMGGSGMGGGNLAGGSGMGGGRRGGRGGDMAAGGSGGGARGGRGGMTGGSGMGGEMGGAGSVEDPSWSIPVFPGLPPYKERRRIVGNVDWPDPEVYGLPTWDATTTNPTSIEIWYAQETLWVYEALIRVIAATNATSEEYKDNIAKAPVKCVEQMLIGQNAAIEFTSLAETIGDLTGKSASGSDMMGSMDSMAMAASSSGGMDGMGMLSLSGSAETQALTKLIIGRYVGDKDDKKDQPLLAEDKPPYAEFNKMPICLKVAIDQTRIPDLLAACANSTMPIDIRHVRICPDNNVPFTMPIPLENMPAEGGAGGMDMMNMGSMMGGGMMGGGSGSGSGSGQDSRGAMGGAAGMDGMGGVEIGRSELSQSEYGPDAIRVEIYGVINIYNEPNKAKFATGASAEEADAEADAIVANAQGAAADADAENADAAAATPAADANANAPAETPAADATAAPANDVAPVEAPADATAPADTATPEEANAE